jgi:hypothetical protein
MSFSRFCLFILVGGKWSDIALELYIYIIMIISDYVVVVFGLCCYAVDAVICIRKQTRIHVRTFPQRGSREREAADEIFVSLFGYLSLRYVHVYVLCITFLFLDFNSFKLAVKWYQDSTWYSWRLPACEASERIPWFLSWIALIFLLHFWLTCFMMLQSLNSHEMRF